MSTDYAFLLKAVFLNPNDLRRLAAECPEILPRAYKPSKFGTHELPRRTNSWPIADVEKYRFLLSERGGCFLHGVGWNIDFTISSSPRLASDCKLWLKQYSAFSTEAILHFLQTLAGHDCYYAFGAAWKEYRARNGYTTVGTMTRGEGWAGREFRRYVPGLYWLNYFSNQYVEAMTIPVEDIVCRLNAARTDVPNGVLLRLYEHPQRWSEFEPAVAAYLRSNKVFFSISSIQLPDRPLDLKEGLAWSTQVFKEWP